MVRTRFYTACTIYLTRSNQGTTPALADKGYPGLCLEDAPLGIRFADYVTSFPAGVNAAATYVYHLRSLVRGADDAFFSFNRRLIRQRGLYMGREHAGKGINIALGPMMNMGRLAQGGRNWEGFGGDPFLTGEASYETILGMQEGGVQACAKHLVGKCVDVSLFAVPS